MYGHQVIEERDGGTAATVSAAPHPRTERTVTGPAGGVRR